MDALGQNPLGPRLVAHAWANPDFKQRLMTNAKAAAAELGFMTGDPDVKTVSQTAAKSAGEHLSIAVFTSTLQCCADSCLIKGSGNPLCSMNPGMRLHETPVADPCSPC